MTERYRDSSPFIRRSSRRSAWAEPSGPSWAARAIARPADHLCPPGDLVQGGVHAELGERDSRLLDQLLVVAPGIRALRTPGTRPRIGACHHHRLPTGATVRSKGIGIKADGTAGSVVYEDVVTRHPDGWKISDRKVTARRAALGDHELTQGLPSRLEGRDGIVNWIAAGGQASPLKYERNRTSAIHDTSDPETIRVHDYVNVLAAATAIGHDLSTRQEP